MLKRESHGCCSSSSLVALVVEVVVVLNLFVAACCWVLPARSHSSLYEEATAKDGPGLRFSPNYRYPFGSPKSKDYNTQGSILGSLHFGKLPFGKQSHLY